MLYSGAELIRTSGPQAQRLDRLPASEPQRKVEMASESQSSLGEDTQNALLRFARFIKKEGKPPLTKKLRKKGLPTAYFIQIQFLEQGQGNGAMLDVYV